MHNETFYVRVLKKYIRHVSDCEGTDFLLDVTVSEGRNGFNRREASTLLFHGASAAREEGREDYANRLMKKREEL